MKNENEEKYKKIEKKVLIYKGLLKCLLKKCKLAKNKLDMFHSTLYRINSIIQLTVIWFSATSTFLQALMTGDNNSSPNIELDNSTGVESIIEQENYITFLDTTTLAITSYSSLIISFARHFKIEERLGNVSNLIERFAEIISRIQYNLELLKPWQNLNRVTSAMGDESPIIPSEGGGGGGGEGGGGDGTKEKEKEWITTEANIKKEYLHILDIKKELFTSYEKIIGMSIYRKYKKLFVSLQNNYEEEESSDCEDGGTNKKSKDKNNKNEDRPPCWCTRPRLLCCACGCNMKECDEKNKKGRSAGENDEGGVNEELDSDILALINDVPNPKIKDGILGKDIKKRKIKVTGDKDLEDGKGAEDNESGIHKLET